MGCFQSKEEQIPQLGRSVLFVCLGNICRSPMAQAIFMEIARKRGVADKWTVDSAATADYHDGEPPDHRTLAVLDRHGIPTDHLARMLHTDDFNHFSWVLTMDIDNLKRLQRLQPPHSLAKVALLGEYFQGQQQQQAIEIEDPFYGGDEEFEVVYQQLTRACHAFLDHVESMYAKHKPRRNRNAGSTSAFDGGD